MDGNKLDQTRISTHPIHIKNKGRKKDKNREQSRRTPSSKPLAKKPHRQKQHTFNKSYPVTGRIHRFIYEPKGVHKLLSFWKALWPLPSGIDK